MAQKLRIEHPAARFLRLLAMLLAAAALPNLSSAQTASSAAQTTTNSTAPAPRGGLRGGFFNTPADRPAPRQDANSQTAHQQLLEKAKKGGIDIYFEGDSITRRWGATDPQYKENLENWKTNFFGWNA